MEELSDEYERQVHDIKYNSYKVGWYMRGGINYEQLMNSSIAEMNMMNDIIEKNLETTKKSQLPFFWTVFFFFIGLPDFGRTMPLSERSNHCGI